MQREAELRQQKGTGIIAGNTVRDSKPRCASAKICALMPEWIEGNVAHLPADIIKNGFKRDVPLSRRALQLLWYLPAPEGGGRFLGLRRSLSTRYSEKSAIVV